MRKMPALVQVGAVRVRKETKTSNNNVRQRRVRRAGAAMRRLGNGCVRTMLYSRRRSAGGKRGRRAGNKGVQARASANVRPENVWSKGVRVGRGENAAGGRRVEGRGKSVMATFCP